MQIVKKILPLMFLAHSLFAQDASIGEEALIPHEFPKFSVSGEYNFMRSGRFLGQNDITSAIDGAFGAAVTFDVGLAKYFNAGAGFSATVGNFFEDESAFIRFSLFGKPKIPITNRLIVFGKFGTGLSVMMLSPVRYFSRKAEARVRSEVDRVYGSQQYGLTSPGLNGTATIGLEYFPFSRFGFALEWGIRTDLIFLTKSKFIDRVLGKKEDAKSTAPDAIHFLGIDMPLMATLHIIL